MSQNWKSLKKKVTKQGPRPQPLLISFIRSFNFPLRMDPQSRLVKTSYGTNHGTQNVAVGSSTNALHISEVQGSAPGQKVVFYAIPKFTLDKTRNVRIKRQCGVFAWCLYILGYCNSLIQFYSKTALSWRFNVAENNVKCQVFLPSYNQIWNFSTYFKEVHNDKFYVNPSSGSLVDTCGQTLRM